MHAADKVLPLESLAKQTNSLRDSGQRVVHCHGVFDLLHIGHIRYLQKARQLGDLLVVTVTPDRYVNKGPHRPAFPEQLRASSLAALSCVDFVAVNDAPTACETLARLRPHVYAKGAEFLGAKTPELLAEEKAAAAAGARVEFIEDVTSSSSRLINNYLGLFSPEVEQYLHDLRSRYLLDDVLEIVRKARELSVLVVGEAIIDEYYFCQTIGKSEKAPIVAARHQSHERFLGGSLAVANHLAAFCGKVDLCAMLGESDQEEAWIRSRLRPRVTPAFVYKPRSPTIVKRRYRESYYGVPLFEIDFLNDEPLPGEEEAALCRLLAGSAAEYDAVIVADYGHAMLGDKARKTLCDSSPFLAVNAQANAANLGFHSISKYPRVDYALLAQQELELEERKRAGDLPEMARAAAEKIGAGLLTVTLGKQGCLCLGGERQALVSAPSLATAVVDRFGAGEAFFAMTSLCAVQKAPLEILAFLGNVAGAQAVSVVGNSQFLDELPLERHILSLWK
jgi:rfaE bifunctional protein nucleotidyltransferase chain/domain